MANTQHALGEADGIRRANPLGAYITTLGVLIFLVSIWLHWVNLGKGDTGSRVSASGYESDGVIPLMAYLGVGFALALLYATKRANRRQHRGLSLASFAVGLASLLWIVSFLIDAISTQQYRDNVSTDIGPWIGLIGALLWAVGSFLLATQPEGDDEHDVRVVARTVGHTETRHVPTVHRTHEHESHGATGTPDGLRETGAVGDDRDYRPGGSTGSHRP